MKKDLTNSITNSGEAFHEGFFSDNLLPIFNFPFCSFPFGFFVLRDLVTTVKLKSTYMPIVKL